MIMGVQDFYYNVSHMERAVQFYTEALGMKVINSNERWTSLDCNGVRVGLHWTGGQVVPKISGDIHGARGGGIMTLKSSDIHADRVLLEGLGAKIIGERSEAWGDTLVFQDPDGNILKLMHRKH